MKKNLLYLTGYLLFLLSCQQTKSPVQVDKWADYRKAYAYLNHRTDSAFYYFNQLTENSKDSAQVSISFNIMASIQSDAGDYFGAQENLMQSLRYMNEKDIEPPGTLANVYNELGLTSIRLKNYAAALPFFDKAVKHEPNRAKKLVIRNNKGLAYQEKGAYTQALAIYGEVIGQTVNRSTYARIMTNMARTRWLAETSYNAAPELLKALQIRAQEKDNWGKNASYAHLADFYTAKRPDSALFFAKMMYVTASQLQSPDDQLEALQKLIRLDLPAKAKKYFARYQHLGDSLQTARNAAKNQFALIRFAAEKTKADNLKLQKDNSEKKYQLIWQSIRFYGTVTVFLILTLQAIIWYRKRKQQQAQETLEAVKETQRIASKKVHDTLGNDIYRVLKNVQNHPTLDRSWLVENIDDIYKRARNLSYEINIPTDERFPENLSNLLQSFGTEDIRVILAGNKVPFWQGVTTNAKLELYYILQEFMVNMQKHSRAANVVVKFEIDSNLGRITYYDDGIGIPSGTAPGNGLTNTGNRIKAIGGTIIFDSPAGKGLEIQLTFPLA